ncbi:unnamed protein product [Sphenostylis stenocarpa]|uniref:Uncharacterized protein n=1 Tax=Sphenostylis stenocarpa TaxID=92480 RepID=A0AA86W464_9FABA|nr:unnamed protein product [Sphenostylis stenocarpa]
MVVRLRQMADQKEPLEGRRPSTLARRPSRGFRWGRWPSTLVRRPSMGSRWGQTAVHLGQTAVRPCFSCL